MSMRYYISTEEASFFNNNSMGYGTGVPTSGTYKVGDFIISSKQENGIFGWVCVKAGTPGEWDVIGSGFAGGSGSGNVVVGYINSVSFNNTRNSIEIGIPEFNKGIDFLEVHYNGLLLAEGVHYSVSSDGLRIESIDGSWNESANDTQQMIFRVLKSEGVKVKEYKNTVDIDNACYEVEHGIPQYNSQFDIIEVHLNGVLLVEGLDYRIENDKLIKIDSNEAWNPYNVQGQKMFIKVMRNVSGMVEVTDNSVGVDKLTPELAENIEAIDDLLDIVGIQNTNISNMDNRITALEEKEVEIDLSGLQTQNKDLVGAINELFQNANNGKELIADAIGEPLDSSDTFQAMSNDIHGLLSTFKTNMMKNGVTVSGTDKFKSLIDKLTTISESESSGSIKYHEGTITIPELGSTSTGKKAYSSTINLDLDFEPMGIIIINYSYGCFDDWYDGSMEVCTTAISNLWTHKSSIGWGDYMEVSLDGTSVTVNLGSSSSGYGVTANKQTLQYLAIGVGEDTTLRDSLAEILGDKGVEVSPEDDMATLIGKVDGIQGSSLDIISATSLPDKVVNNQIVLLTNVKPSTIKLTTVETCNPTTEGEVNISYVIIKNSNPLYITQGNITVVLYIQQAKMYNNGKIEILPTYIGVNNEWKDLNETLVILNSNNRFVNNDYFNNLTCNWTSWGTADGNTNTEDYYEYNGINSDTGVLSFEGYIYGHYKSNWNNNSLNGYIQTPFIIDTSLYNKLIIEAQTTLPSPAYGFNNTDENPSIASVLVGFYSTGVTDMVKSVEIGNSESNGYKTYELDISSLNSNYNLGIYVYEYVAKGDEGGVHVDIKRIELVK